MRVSGHFKVYKNSCLISLNSSSLGYDLGPFTTYLLSNSPIGLQGALNIMSQYANQHQLKFNAGKTKIVVTGSKIDIAYYKETKPLLFALLGPVYAYRCLLSPAVQGHLWLQWRMYNLPVLMSGIQALPIRPANIKPTASFHQKVLKRFLKLSQSSAIPALNLLLGELSAEAVLNINTLTLFHNFWTNPDTTVFKMVAYILKMCDFSFHMEQPHPATLSQIWCAFYTFSFSMISLVKCYLQLLCQDQGHSVAWELPENKMSHKLRKELPQCTPVWAIWAASCGPPQYLHYPSSQEAPHPPQILDQ